MERDQIHSGQPDPIADAVEQSSTLLFATPGQADSVPAARWGLGYRDVRAGEDGRPTSAPACGEHVGAGVRCACGLARQPAGDLVSAAVRRSR